MIAAAATVIGGQAPAPQSKPATSPQAPAPAPAPATGQPKPAAPPQTTTPPVRRAPAAPASARGGMAITVTDQVGATISGVHVTVFGATDRNGETNASGQLNLPGMLAGNYRLRFASEKVITYEREVTVVAGRVTDVDIALNPAPKPSAPPPPPPAPAPVEAPKAPAGPTGQPQSVSVPDLLEKEFVGKQPRRESLLSCSGNIRTTMLQINEPLPERRYADGDIVYYVVGGEGTLKQNGRDSRVNTNTFLSVPRGTSHSFERRGNRPLILLAVLGGEACEQAK